MANWNDIQKEWETTKITLAALATKHDIKLGTLKSRKSREKWSRAATKKDATKRPKKDATIKKVATIKEPVVVSDNLNDKQRLFCIYYIKYFNATKAYQKAYECAYTTAMSNGHSLLRNTKVISEIKRMKEEQTNGLMLNNYDVLQKYIDIAFADISDYVELGDEGYSITVKPLGQMDTSIIGELSNTENGIKLKLADKMKALDMLAKVTDLLSDNNKKRLQEEKLKAETMKVAAETKNEETGTSRVVIVNDKEAMKRAMQHDN